tara:strand:+ start:120 stop:695 length:576 start_codon:yes stop_codon:yes gene_type:complete
MVGEFQRLSDVALCAIKQDPSLLDELPWLWWVLDMALEEPERSIAAYGSEAEAQAAIACLPPEFADLPVSFSLEKDWHVMHYLLTNRVWGGKGPLSDAILGGTPIGPNNDFGPARYLEPEEVSAVATALEPVDRPRLLRHWPPWFLPRWRLYYVGSYGEAEAEAVAFEFSELRDYYLTARANGEGMILKIA